jgi:hypothetical protein
MSKRKEISFIEMKPEDWEKLVELIKECEESFESKHFDSGEKMVYVGELKKLRTNYLPMLKEKIGSKAVGLEFYCSPRCRGWVDFKIIIGGLKIDIFQQFYDTFFNRLPDAERYVMQNLSKTSDIIMSLNFED